VYKKCEYIIDYYKYNMVLLINDRVYDVSMAQVKITIKGIYNTVDTKYRSFFW
jgi:hypothetical protein